MINEYVGLPIFQRVEKIKNPILSRICYLGTLPITVLMSAADTVIATGACALTIITLGKVKNIAEFAFEQAENTARLGGDFSFGTISAVINPKSAERIGGSGTPLAISFANHFFKHLEKESFMQYPMLLRISHLVRLPALLIARVADLAFGIIDGIRSLIAYGENKDLINHAFDQLENFNILQDIVSCTLKMLTLSENHFQKHRLLK